MSEQRRIEMLRVDREGGAVLLSPLVGWFTAARREGEVLVAGETAGCVITLGVARELVVPAGPPCVVRSKPPANVHAPVGYKTVLYELAPLAANAELGGASAAKKVAESGLVVRSPSAGRFWHRPSPSEKALVEVGSLVEAGTALGLVEVMKTFTHVVYRPEHGLPPRARIARVLAADGAEVEDGGELFELAPL
jgi:biotin carboxyl carrier protein